MKNRHIIRIGEKAILAEMTELDQPFFQQWLATNEELRKQIADHTVPSLEDQAAWFARSQADDRKMFSILTLKTDELIGNGGFVDIDHKHKTAQLRITLGHGEFVGKGFGTDATKLLIAYGFEKMGLKRIYLHVLIDNLRAIRSYEKAGFVKKEEYTAPSGAQKLLMEIYPVH